MKFSNEKILINSIEDIIYNSKNKQLLLEEIIYRFESKVYPNYDNYKESIYILEDRNNEHIYRSKLKKHTFEKLKNQIKEDSNLSLVELPIIPVKLVFNGDNFNIFDEKLNYLLPNISITSVYEQDINILNEIFKSWENIYIINTDFENLKSYFN